MTEPHVQARLAPINGRDADLLRRSAEAVACFMSVSAEALCGCAGYSVVVESSERSLPSERPCR